MSVVDPGCWSRKSRIPTQYVPPVVARMIAGVYPRLEFWWRVVGNFSKFFGELSNDRLYDRALTLGANPRSVGGSLRYTQVQCEIDVLV